MLVENITFLTAFIATSGLAVMGILIAYQLFQNDKTIDYQSLLYQQIFLFSFFFYSIWGNLALRIIVSEVSMNDGLEGKLAFFIPLLGVPFLMVSWFMLLNFGFKLNGWQISKKWVYSYFAVFLVIFSASGFLFQRDFVSIPSNPDTFLLRLFAFANLFAHLVFLFPFLKPNHKLLVHDESIKLKKCILIYIPATVFYSIALFFSNSLGYAGTAISFTLTFAASASLPICFKFKAPAVMKETIKRPDSFESFCDEYQISKREAEIVIEICAGKTNKAIAEKLFITLQTVKDHTHRIYTKTQVKSRVQLANLVREKAGKLHSPVRT